MSLITEIFYHNNFIPPEWIAAHGFKPVLFVPSLSSEELIVNLQGLCPYARSLANSFAGLYPEAVLISNTSCDQLRRLSEFIDHKLFLFNLPATWQSNNAFNLYKSELLRLSDFLVACGGHKPDALKLKDAIHFYTQQRQKYLVETDETTLPYVGILGGPLVREHFALYDTVIDNGGLIAFDSSETSIQLLALTLNHNYFIDQLNFDSLFASMAKNFFYNVPAPFRRPDNLLFDFLHKMLGIYALKGLILVRYLWCDHWCALLERARQEFSLPIIEIELNDIALDARTSTRIEAFMETLKAQV